MHSTAYTLQSLMKQNLNTDVADLAEVFIITGLMISIVVFITEQLRLLSWLTHSHHHCK